MARASDRNTRTVALHAEMGRYAGWGGLNLALHEEFLPNYEASDCLNWTNRIGLDSDNIGVLCTRCGYADGPKYEVAGGYPDTSTTYGPTRLLQKFYPGALLDETSGEMATKIPQILRLAQTASGNTGTKFQYSVGAQDGVTGYMKWEDIAIGLKNGGVSPHPVGGYFPQSIVLGLPTPKFCWVDLENGLHIYDGTTHTAQAIPKSNGSGNITGALWLEQMDGRLIVSGNWLDDGEGCRIYYSGPNATDQWTSSGFGGVTTVYAADSRAGTAAPVRITGLATLQGMLVTFTEDARYVTAGLGTTMESTRMFPGAGCWSGKLINKYQDKLYWWGKDGAYEWNGGEVLRISDKIWNKKFLLTLLSAPKWFSFVYKDQWWTCVKLKNGTYAGNGADFDDDHNWRNFVYDFKTNNWYMLNVPMCAAFSSLGGLTDSDKLFFASPVQYGAHEYKRYCYGYDDVEGATTYADNCYTDKGVRLGYDIRTWWETGALDMGIKNLKRFEDLQVRGQLEASHNLVTSPISYARAGFKLDLMGSAYKYLDFPSTLAYPYFDLGFKGAENPASPDNDNNQIGHLVKIRWDVIGQKRVQITKVYVECEDLGVMRNEQ